MGTLDYLAPEQALAPDRADVRSDLYSLGATLRFLLLGEPLFPNAGLASKIIMHQTVVPPPVSQLRADVPEGVSRVIDWMLKKDPRERPAMPAAVIDELMPWYEPVPPPEMSVSLLLQEQNEAAASDDTRMRKNFVTDHGTVGGKKGDRRENPSGTTPAP
jgi:serine/threonine protein kinase